MKQKIVCDVIGVQIFVCSLKLKLQLNVHVRLERISFRIIRDSACHENVFFFYFVN